MKKLLQGKTEKQYKFSSIMVVCSLGLMGGLLLIYGLIQYVKVIMSSL